MKDCIINTPITELYNSLFNIKEKMTSAEWVEVSTLLMQVHQMKTIVKWETRPCDCCHSSENETDSSDSDNSDSD